MLSVRPSRKLRKHLAEHGIKAKASVLEISKRGTANLDQPSTSIGTADADPIKSFVRRKTKIRVEPERGEAFEIEAKLTYRLIAEPQPGAVIPVIYDPDDYDKIMVDEDTEMRDIQDGGVESANEAIAAAGYDPAAIWNAVEAAQKVKPGEPTVDPDLLEQAMESARKAQQMGFGGEASQEWLSRMQGGGPPGAASGSSQEDVVARLERLTELKDQGALSEEEFETAKRQLLGDD